MTPEQIFEKLADELVSAEVKGIERGARWMKVIEINRDNYSIYCEVCTHHRQRLIDVAKTVTARFALSETIYPDGYWQTLIIRDVEL